MIHNSQKYVTRKRIVICEPCEGAGHFKVRKNPYLKEAVYELQACSRCKGSGRLLLHTTLTPYTPK